MVRSMVGAGLVPAQLELKTLTNLNICSNITPGTGRLMVFPCFHMQGSLPMSPLSLQPLFHYSPLSVLFSPLSSLPIVPPLFRGTIRPSSVFLLLLAQHPACLALFFGAPRRGERTFGLSFRDCEAPRTRYFRVSRSWQVERCIEPVEMVPVLFRPIETLPQGWPGVSPPEMGGIFVPPSFRGTTIPRHMIHAPPHYHTHLLFVPRKIQLM